MITHTPLLERPQPRTVVVWYRFHSTTRDRLTFAETLDQARAGDIVAVLVGPTHALLLDEVWDDEPAVGPHMRAAIARGVDVRVAGEPDMAASWARRFGCQQLQEVC